MIGRTLGQYRIIEKIGGGGMGVVYKALDARLDRTVALKFLPGHLANSPARRKRFMREARAASALDHPNVCTIYDIGETDDGQMYIAMGYCSGVPLDTRIAAGALPIDACVDIAVQIAAGLQAAHAAGIVHRDIKPANVIVSAGDAVKIVDFGLAKSSGETALTRDGTTVGTAAYMSPEQARGSADADHRTDIWSLGAVLYEMVAGRHPFAADHESAQIYRILHDDPAPVSTLRPDVPRALAAVIDKMLHKDAAARYGSMEEAKAALEASRSGEVPAEAPPTGDLLARARSAFERQAWSDAFAAFVEADGHAGLPPDDLARLGEAARWMSRGDDIVAAWERAHAGFVKAGRSTDAARVAINLAHEAFVTGKRSVCNGWLKRAQRLLDGAPDVVENGYLARQRAQIAIEADVDLDAALDYVETARGFAQKHDDTNLLALALQDRGRALVLKDRVAEGIELLEEAMTLAVSGELQPMVVGSTYCNMISMCNRIADYRRAAEWGDSAQRWCAPHDESVFPGICSVHRADVMHVRGAWQDAQGEAERVIRTCDDRHTPIAAEGFYLMGEIQTRRGQFDRAESSFQEAHQRGRHPMPGLATLRLAQGRLEDACSLIDRTLQQDSIALERIRMLPAGVEVALAAGNVDAARDRAEELHSLAARYQSSVFRGRAEHAAGIVALAEGKIDDAVASLTAALTHWKAADLPYDEARTRARLAAAYARRGESDLAALEVGSARQVFTKLGANPDLERLDDTEGRKRDE
jgi:tetratricopeptide (TPR) repeat protein